MSDDLSKLIQIAGRAREINEQHDLSLTLSVRDDFLIVQLSGRGFSTHKRFSWFEVRQSADTVGMLNGYIDGEIEAHERAKIELGLGQAGSNSHPPYSASVRVPVYERGLGPD